MFTWKASQKRGSSSVGLEITAQPPTQGVVRFAHLLWAESDETFGLRRRRPNLPDTTHTKY